MKCIDEEAIDYALQGSYNTDKASNLMVVFERCDKDGPIKCQSDTQISEWLEFKYMLTLENEKRFVVDRFEGERISALSETTWYALSPTIRTDYVK